ALGQYGNNGVALHDGLDGLVGEGSDLDGDVVVADLGNAAEHATLGDHLVALGQVLDELSVFFLTLHLRPDHQEVQNHEHQNDGQHAHQRVFTAGGLGEGQWQGIDEGHLGCSCDFFGNNSLL